MCQGTLEEQEFFLMLLLVGTLEIIWFKLLIEETRDLMGRGFKSIGKFMARL